MNDELNLESHIYDLYGPIEEETVSLVVSSLYRLLDSDVDKIKFLISSVGGDLLEAFSLYDIICLLKKKNISIEMLGVGKIMSAGLLILSSGTKGQRKATKNTRFMIHQASAGLEGTVIDVKNLLKETNLQQERYIELLSENSDLSIEQIKTMFNSNHDLYFSSQEALEYGLIDKIEG